VQTLEIANAIERLPDFFAEFRSLIEDRLPHIRGRVAKARQIVVAVDLKHVR